MKKESSYCEEEFSGFSGNTQAILSKYIEEDEESQLSVMKVKRIQKTKKNSGL